MTAGKGAQISAWLSTTERRVVDLYSVEYARRMTRKRESAVSNEQLVAWLNDPAPFSELNAEDESLRITTVRLPVSMLEELDSVAGRDKEGRAGVIRAAVAHYLAHLREAS